VAQSQRALTAGTRQGALLRYRVMAYVVGVLLLVVFAAIPFGSVESIVGPLHGALYIVYLVTVLDVFIRFRLRLLDLIAMVAGGWVPFLAFVVERWMRGRLSPLASTPT
jgi:integral membrane protein